MSRGLEFTIRYGELVQMGALLTSFS